VRDGEANSRIDVPIENLQLDDAKAYDVLNKANTLGIFQWNWRHARPLPQISD